MKLTTLGERVTLALQGPPKRTQTALAKACGIHPVSVNDWVHDRTQTIEGANLLSAAAFLEVNPKWLATGVGAMRSGQHSSLTHSPSGHEVSGYAREPSAAALVQELAAIAAPLSPKLRKDLGKVLIALLGHPDDQALAIETMRAVERLTGKMP
jgi:hypothetical protein